MSPLVSILVPVYNRSDLIAQTLRSALDQTYPAIEVVVVDNASTDGTWELLSRLALTDSRLRVFRNPSNLGPVRNWLKCLARAQGSLCKILWSDDLISPGFLSATVPLLSDPSVGFAYSAAIIFEGSDPRSGSYVFASPGAGLHPTAEFIEGSLMNADYPVSPGCAIFRTEDVRKNLRRDVPNRLGSDFSMHAIGNDLLLFLLTAADYPKFALVTEPLSQFRAHAGSISIESGDGRLQLHYDVAKASFVEHAKLPKCLVRRFNALLWLDLMRFNGKAYGIHRISDFYRHAECRIHFRTLIWMLYNRLKRKVSRTFDSPPFKKPSTD